MSTIFGLAYSVAVIMMVFGVVRTLFFKEDLDAIKAYLNMDEKTSTIFKYFIYSIWASAAAFVLTLVFPPLIILMFIISVISKGIAWAWIYESYNKGFITTWYEAVKAKFNSK